MLIQGSHWIHSAKGVVEIPALRPRDYASHTESRTARDDSRTRVPAEVPVLAQSSRDPNLDPVGADAQQPDRPVGGEDEISVEDAYMVGSRFLTAIITLVLIAATVAALMGGR